MALDVTMHHPEIGNSLVPCNVADHRHTHETEQELGLLTDATVQVHFTPPYVPITRGIVDACHCFAFRTGAIQALPVGRRGLGDELLPDRA